MLTPLIIGFGINYLALGAFLAGVILTGQLMANFLSNSGGAWDNAKKYIEDGNEGGKGSEAHKAAVIGDTVGDPFKDTAGPALNPLIKVMNLVSLLVLPAIISLRNDDVRFVIAGVVLVVLIGAVRSRSARAAGSARSPRSSPRPWPSTGAPKAPPPASSSQVASQIRAGDRILATQPRAGRCDRAARRTVLASRAPRSARSAAVA